MHDPHAHHAAHKDAPEVAPVPPGSLEHPEQGQGGASMAHRPTHRGRDEPTQHGAHAGHAARHGAHDKHAGHSVAMFRDKFWLSLLLTIPTLVWGHMLPRVLGYTPPHIPGAHLVAPLLGTGVLLRRLALRTGRGA